MSVSAAKQRNADLRHALQTVFPGTKFRVRNGTEGRAAIEWVDGPPRDQVREVALSARTHPSGEPWAFTAKRSLSVRGLTRAYWHAQRASEKFYTPPVPPEERRFGSTGESVTIFDDRAALAAPETPEEQNALDLLLTIAGDLGPEASADKTTVRMRLARVVHEHGPAVAASSLPAAD